jgi:hypothetical protein
VAALVRDSYNFKTIAEFPTPFRQTIYTILGGNPHKSWASVVCHTQWISMPFSTHMEMKSMESFTFRREVEWVLTKVLD